MDARLEINNDVDEEFCKAAAHAEYWWVANLAADSS
jgi:hypothetical protein